MKLKKIVLVLMCSLMFLTTVYYAISGSTAGDTCTADSDCIDGFNCHYSRCFAAPGTACSTDEECAGSYTNLMSCVDEECCGKYAHPCGNQRTGPTEDFCCNGYSCELNVGGWYWCAEDETITTEIWTTDLNGNPKDDFPPDSIVYIHGQGFSSDANVDIDVTRPDSTVESGSETTNSLGEFIYEYNLNGIEGLYQVYANDGSNSAETTFTDVCEPECGDGIVECGEECEFDTNCNDVYCTLSSHKTYPSGECKEDCTCKGDGSPVCVVGSCGALCVEDTDCSCPGDYCDGTTLIDYPDHGRCGTAGSEGCLCQTDTGLQGDCEPEVIDDAPECSDGICDETEELIESDPYESKPTSANVDGGSEISHLLCDDNVISVDANDGLLHYINMEWNDLDLSGWDGAYYFNFMLYHEESAVFIKVELKNQFGDWIEVCDPAESSTFTWDTCDLMPYFDILSEVSLIELRIVVSKDENCHEYLKCAKLETQLYKCEELCGNGVLDPGEECDDGNNIDGDGCDADCTKPETCNSVCTIPIGCDGGYTCYTGYCRNPSCLEEADCECPECGDGVLDPGEECDDGNNIDGDGCDADCTKPETCNSVCTIPIGCDGGYTCYTGFCRNPSCTSEPDCTCCPECGDGEVIPPEECELPNTFNNPYCPQTPTEQCNDTKYGTRDDYGDCDENCLCEPDDFEYECVVGECGAECDSDDDCSDCNPLTIEWCNLDTCLCETEPYCGDGILTPPEECDDGNNIDGDGCDANCTRPETCNSVCTEPIGCDGGYTCYTGYCRNQDCLDEPDCICPECGDGVKDPGEECEPTFPFTGYLDNTYCPQTPTEACNDTKYATRDPYGDCVECLCDEDPFDYQCVPGECGAECDSNDDCEGDCCEATYDDYCNDTQLIEYDDNKILDSTTVTDSCENTCEEDCLCTDCEPDCSAPPTNAYCVPDVCGAECTTDEDCEDNGCEKTFNDYCDDYKLVEYDHDKILDSTTVTDDCENTCEEECLCTNCEPECETPPTREYCVPNVCNAICDSDDDCDDQDETTDDYCLEDCTCEHEKIQECPTDAKVKIIFDIAHNINVPTLEKTFARTYVGPSKQIFGNSVPIDLVYPTDMFIVDSGLVEEVPGLALERGDSWIRVVMHGSHPSRRYA